MKKLIYLLPTLLMAGCSGVFSDGLWLVPVGLAATAIWTWLRYFFGVGEPSVKKTTGPLVYASILSAAAVISYFLIMADK